MRCFKRKCGGLQFNYLNKHQSSDDSKQVSSELLIIWVNGRAMKALFFFFSDIHSDNHEEKIYIYFKNLCFSLDSWSRVKEWLLKELMKFKGHFNYLVFLNNIYRCLYELK